MTVFERELLARIDRLTERVSALELSTARAAGARAALLGIAGAGGGGVYAVASWLLSAFGGG